MKRRNVHLARDLRHRMTDAECLLWRHLRSRYFQSRKFRRQHPVDAFIVDFICLDAKLIVELDGGQHLDQFVHDSVRTKALNRAGYRVIRFWNDDVLLRTDAVLEQILLVLDKPPHPNPLPKGERENRTSEWQGAGGDQVRCGPQRCCGFAPSPLWGEGRGEGAE